MAQQSEQITIKIFGEGERTIEKGTTLAVLAAQRETPRPILLAKVNNELAELDRPLWFDCNVQFLDISDPNGLRTYQRSVAFLMLHAANQVLEQPRLVIAHSVNKNYYCEFPELGREVTDELLAEIEAVMHETAAKSLPIERVNISIEQGLALAEEMGLRDQVELLKYRRTSTVNFYHLDGFYTYFYGQLAANTAHIPAFKLIKRSKGFLLQFPSAIHDYQLAETVPVIKVSEVFEESKAWARILKIDTVGSLNNKLCTKGINEVVRITEALHEKKIAYLADQIAGQGKKIVLIAGPTSSGKTTFATRLSVQLRVNSLNPHVISLDNYYLNREDIPRDKDGKFDFETINALDVAQINEDLAALLAGETVQIPRFNFLSGKREYKGDFLTLKPDDVLIMEGIHGLNGKLGADVPRDNAFRIFISAMTQLNVDDHNRIPTTDTRLIRRIVRDFQFRGYSAQRTIDMWPSVMRGESNYIFPFQEEADVFFNSALIYEMCVLKQFVEPLLFAIEPDEPAYTEAKRLIKFLDCFLGATSETVPPNSILREFIGGSCFSVH